MEKFKRALGRLATSSDTGFQLAAVLISGALNPVDQGHLFMLRQARARLERAGFAVCGGWLSPTHDKPACEKAQSRGTCALSFPLRLHLAELATSDDDFISVSSWEAGLNGRIPDGVEVISSLQCELTTALPPELLNKHVTIFLVCGSHNGKYFKDLERVSSAGDMNGVVVVPRRGIDTILEKPGSRIFVTEPVPGRLDNLNSSRLCEAIQSGDTAYVRQALPEAAARLLLEPTPRERAEFGDDLEHLAALPASTGPWPCGKFAEHLMALPPEEGKVMALLVASGAMSPTHRGHVLMLHAAKQRLEDAGYVVRAAWLSPFSDEKAAVEAAAKSSPKLRSAFRQKVAELSVCNDSFVEVGTWEASTDGPARPREVAQALHEHVLQRFRYSLEGISVKTFFVCGGDVVEPQGLTKGFAAQHDLGVVSVGRGDDDFLMELPHHLVFTADALDGDASALSSSALREAIKAGDAPRAAHDMALAAARFVLTPTATERAEFQQEFDLLGVAPPSAPDLKQMRESLKAALKAWAGPSGSICSEDLGKLLCLLDPSWTSQELDALLQPAANAADGRVDTDGFVDGIFSNVLQRAVTA